MKEFSAVVFHWNTDKFTSHRVTAKTEKEERKAFKEVCRYKPYRRIRNARSYKYSEGNGRSDEF